MCLHVPHKERETEKDERLSGRPTVYILETFGCTMLNIFSISPQFWLTLQVINIKLLTYSIVH